MEKEKVDEALKIFSKLLMCIVLSAVMSVFGEGWLTIRAKGSVIDENTIIRAEQAESIADHIGDYGWDSRGAYFRYYDSSGSISGDLGLILFCDENGIASDRMWDEWGNSFPDWWGRMLAEKVRNSVSSDRIRAVRHAFADSVTFECTWVIAIGMKSESVGSGPYLTLRTDDTLRAAYGVNTAALDPPERLFAGDEMADSLSVLLSNEKWGTTSQRVFRERNPYIYRVSIKSYSVRIYATDCTICAKAGKREGEYCTHNNKELMLYEIPIIYDGKRCVGEDSFVWQGQIADYFEPDIEGYRRVPSGDDLSGLYGIAQNGKIIAEKDSVLYLAYKMKEIEGQTDSETGDTPDPEQPDPGPSDPDDPFDTGNPSGPEIPSGSDIPSAPEYEPIPEESASTIRGSISLEAMDTMGKAVICSDIFNVRQAIPSTESVYIRASARNYLYRIRAEIITGKVPLSVTVGVPYKLIWKDEEDNEYEEDGISETTTVIYRDYSYIHLQSLELHLLDRITIANPAIYPEMIELHIQDTGMRQPVAYSPMVYGGDEPGFGGNIDYPLNYSPYILADRTITVEGGYVKPEIPAISAEEAYWTAQERIGVLMCRNDEFKMDSADVLGESGWHEYNTGSMRINMPQPQVIEFDTSDMMGPDHLTIPAGKRNGTYQTTSRLVKYRTTIMYGAAGTPYDAMIEVNPVCVFTPVYCDVNIAESDSTEPNSSYFQENRQVPDDAFIIVAGRSNSLGSSDVEHGSEDLEIRFINKGYHPIYAAVLSNDHDYSSNMNGKNGGTYIDGNYLRFPFGVYKDVGNDRKELNDEYVPKNTWVRVEGNQRFYPGEVIKEGYYDIEAKTVAVNAYGSDDQGSSLPAAVNTSQNEYAAVDSVRVYVSGKLYGLTLIDISSKADWEDVFSEVTAGSGYAENKYIKYINELGTYPVDLGNDGTLRTASLNGKYTKDKIIEKVFYYTAGTRNELGKDTGRHERYTFPLIAGSHPDSSKSNKGILKSGYRWEFSIKSSGYSMGLEGSKVVITPRFYLLDKNGNREEVDIYIPDGRGLIRKMAQNIEIKKPYAYAAGIQVWDFSFIIPKDSRMILKNRTFSYLGRNYANFNEYMAAKGIVDKNDDVWLKGGVIVVNFDIRAFSPSGDEMFAYLPEQNGQNMWKIEGQDIDKKDFFGTEYDFEYGDIALVYIDQGAVSDYTIDHQN
ncbi:MAG: hypothetical protein J5824_07475 [Lachnospiraceae bacterium]|nr:hypothetical protein [Lachnospiraceae bacterium]